MITVLAWAFVVLVLLCLFPVAMLVVLVLALAFKVLGRRFWALAAFRFRPGRPPQEEVEGGLSGDELDRWARIVAGHKKTARERAYDNRSEP